MERSTATAVTAAGLRRPRDPFNTRVRRRAVGSRHGTSTFRTPFPPAAMRSALVRTAHLLDGVIGNVPGRSRLRDRTCVTNPRVRQNLVPSDLTPAAPHSIFPDTPSHPSSGRAQPCSHSHASNKHRHLAPRPLVAPATPPCRPYLSRACTIELATASYAAEPREAAVGIEPLPCIPLETWAWTGVEGAWLCRTFTSGGQSRR